MAKQKKSKRELEDPTFKQIAKNRRALHDFEVDESYEVGLVLVGSEVKSLRNGNVSFNDAHARIKNDEVWLHELHIAPYEMATWTNHKPTRLRKLLLHRKQIAFLKTRISRSPNLTLVPLELYFTKGRAKLVLGLCKGRKKGDKRQALRKQQDQRSMEREVRRGPDY